MYTKEFYQKNFKKNIDRLNLKKKDPWDLNYHISPNTGWLNDPNGLCQFNGTYHIYFQNDPLDCNKKNIIWGHVSTNDFINYTYEQPFIFADCDLDKDGAYSGSAFIKDDKINFFYTGNVKHPGDYDYINVGREHNTIKIISKDGYTFDKKELLLSNEDYPSDLTKHVRDPKIHEENGIYYMFLGARSKEDKGKVLIFKSEDLINFNYHMEILTDYDFGYMWECPDFIELDSDKFLICCPQGVESQEYKYQNVYKSGYFPIDINFEKKTYKLGEFVELDYGFDFYAPQTFEDENHRKILIGWMGMPDAEYTNPTVKNHWQQCLTIPRTLKSIGGKIIQQPIKELNELRDGKILYKNNQLIKEDSYEFESEVSANKFYIGLRKDVSLEYEGGILRLTLKNSGYGRNERKVAIDRIYNIRILSDTSAIEIFINDGKYLLSTRVYSKEKFFKASIDGHIYKINKINWNEKS